jgi:hypothetical protein
MGDRATDANSEMIPKPPKTVCCAGDSKWSNEALFEFSGRALSQIFESWTRPWVRTVLLLRRDGACQTQFLVYSTSYGPHERYETVSAVVSENFELGDGNASVTRSPEPLPFLIPKDQLEISHKADYRRLCFWV